MKSKTVSFNIFQVLATLGLLIAAYTVYPGIPQWLFVTMSVAGMVISQAITFFSPSGAFIGEGQNWSIGKWIARIGAAVLAIFALLNEQGWAVATISLLTPFIEIIIRMYGSETAEQKAAAVK